MYSSDTSDYDSDEELSSKKCFDVELPKNFDPNIIPSSGEEYLQYVIYEARNCEKVALSNVDSRKFDKNQTYWIDEGDTDYIAAPSSMLPSKQWQENIIQEFNDYRDYVASLLPNASNTPNLNISDWIKKMALEYPQLPVICNFNCCDKSKMLKQIIVRLKTIKEGLSVDSILGCWIYNVLCVLDKPLTPDKYLLLRDLSRTCSKIRSKLSCNASYELYTPLNVFICIIGRYFGQLDLTDD